MHYRILLIISIYLLLGNPELSAQKVGVVLSGGGAAGVAHIGFLKALEENNIPIDFIAGTSMGALVAGMYAAGYSPEEIEQYFVSEKFKTMSQGEIEEKYIYYFKQREPDASWITAKISKDSSLITSIPTNVISPFALDFEMMSGLAGASAVSDYNFDKLFIPFRCVAADVEAKQQVVFKSGYLSQAIRASMSYPFYLKPISVNGKLLFDGGLYNNFPADVMYNDFLPDVILGSNVAGNAPPPNEDNVLSQIKSMLVSKTNYDLKCENGIIVNPDPMNEIGTFDFSKVETAISKGYEETMKKMDDIDAMVKRHEMKESVEKKRREFNKQKPEIVFDQIHLNGLNKRQSNYVRKQLRRRNQTITLEALKPNYYKLFSDNKIRHIYPIAKYNKLMGLYDLNLDVKLEKDIFVDFGGNFSSRPINMAFIGVQYNYLGNVAFSLMANSYFGKLYGSTNVRARIDFPVSLPFFIEPEFTLNRWDYFKSHSTFFEDNKPSYLVQYETYGGMSVGLPAWNKGKIRIGASFVHLTDEYYQTKSFSSIDTADQTVFNNTSPYFFYERSTLNRKQYANQGTYFAIKARYINGNEINIPGSTSLTDQKIYSKLHEWYQLKLTFDNYYKRRGILRLGWLAEGVYSTQPLFNNYTSSILRAPAFQPTPESKTLFLESFRAYQYAAFGHKFIFSITKNIDLRFEGYFFQPFQRIIKKEDLSAEIGEPLDKRYFLGMAAGVYQSPIGPLSLSVNYYHNVPEVAPLNKTPLTFMFHFGYILFNRRALE